MTRESEWNDEQRQAVFDYRAYQRGIHGGCGNHASVAMDPTVARYTDHFSLVCEDCRAIEHDRNAWHKSSGHPQTGPCPCDDEVFVVARREPLPDHVLDQIRDRPNVAGWITNSIET